ncbi:S-methyl-5'-thioadenosine phosphorylase [Apis mellifera caucasica]|uniref:S-methyl-5'-thioadenosine phosphorylase n=1 Tax=Apis mellifera TaxID=7460 RepID=A0A7M7R9L1_APIME|nr:S-methyl-5'-thioadenosine phosphorylase [Apis mellifera]KAG6800888.1 S-methyl-5'-thioadenosine phosphorylase [Apis mellifera caucasica]KAG9433713.1 S-methyl-5'-thioadenosine phosphorylase [Apis mellifera carnica]|eukprot:XP_625118.2 S-methyl-5'-thioadenosine phosphorylase [Apis mellifera]
MNKYKIKVGIIGGSGLNNPQNQILNCQSITTREKAKNEFGFPSSDLYHGNINDVDVILLSRHGPDHKISPTAVNYRANIEALRLAGCTHIIASTACGSLQDFICKGLLVVPDSFLDRTIKRSTTFYDGTSPKYSGVCHMPMEPAFDPTTSQILFEVGKELGYMIRKGGTIVTIEGPRFSSKAESNAFRMWGGHLVNMTTCPEVYLAKEAGLLYAVVAVATDYDCWKDCEDNVHAADVMEVFKQNINKIRNIFIKTVKLIGERNWDKEIDTLQILSQSSNVSSHSL